jgi:hypothetical protein
MHVGVAAFVGVSTSVGVWLEGGYFQQGDQIGQIFATSLFLAFFNNLKSTHFRGKYLFPRYKLCIYFDKICWATLWDVFFANSSGHPDFEQPAPFFRGLSSERFQIISKERCM